MVILQLDAACRLTVLDRVNVDLIRYIEDNLPDLDTELWRVLEKSGATSIQCESVKIMSVAELTLLMDTYRSAAMPSGMSV